MVVGNCLRVDDRLARLAIRLGSHSGDRALQEGDIDAFAGKQARAESHNVIPALRTSSRNAVVPHASIPGNHIAPTVGNTQQQDNHTALRALQTMEYYTYLADHTMALLYAYSPTHLYLALRA